MNLIELLLQMQVPLWLVFLLSAIGIITIRYYTYRLDQAKEKSSKQFEHILAIRKLEYEKTLELIQERHRDKLDAIDKVNASLQEFDHSVHHLRVGHNDQMYITHLKENYYKARKLTREYQSLLGEAFHEAVNKQTKIGLGILDATFTVTGETINHYRKKGVNETILSALTKFVDQPIPVTSSNEINDIVNSIDSNMFWITDYFFRF